MYSYQVKQETSFVVVLRIARGLITCIVLPAIIAQTFGLDVGHFALKVCALFSSRIHCKRY